MFLFRHSTSSSKNIRQAGRARRLPTGKAGSGHRAISYKSSVSEAHTSGLSISLPAEAAAQASIPARCQYGVFRLD
jgi:hypothetical protein